MKAYREYRRAARASLAGHWTGSALVCLIAIAIIAACGAPSIIATAVPGMENISNESVIAGSVAQLLIGIPMSLAILIAFLRLIRGHHHMLHNLLRSFNRNWFRLMAAGFMSRLVMGLTGIFTLGILGVYFALAYAMVPYLIEDYPSLSWVEAMRTSRQMMDGHKWELLWLTLSFIGWILLAIVTCGIGLLWVYPYMNTTFAHYYEDLKKETIVED